MNVKCKNLNQRGFGAVEVLLVILILAIVGFAGWYVWKSTNETNKTLDETNQTEQSSTKKSSKIKQASLKQAKFDSRFGVEISFSYPETWTINETAFKDDQSNVSQSFELTSPNKGLTVNYMLDNNGVGGACLPAESGKIVSLKSADVSGFSGAKLLEAKTSDDYMNVIALVNAEVVDRAKVGGSSCDIGFAGIIDLHKPNGIHLRSSVRVPGGSNTAADFDKITSNADFGEAKQILQSTVVK